MNNKTLPVEQVDRNMAADCYRLAPLGPQLVQHILDGMEDDDLFVQAFAKHRIQIAEAVKEACAKVAESYPSLEYADIPVIKGVASAIRNLDLSTLLSKRGM